MYECRRTENTVSTTEWVFKKQRYKIKLWVYNTYWLLWRLLQFLSVLSIPSPFNFNVVSSRKNYWFRRITAYELEKERKGCSQPTLLLSHSHNNFQNATKILSDIPPNKYFFPELMTLKLHGLSITHSKMVGEVTKTFQFHERDRWKRVLLLHLTQENKVDGSITLSYLIVGGEDQTYSFNETV